MSLIWSAAMAIVKAWGAKMLNWFVKPPGEYVALVFIAAIVMAITGIVGYHRGQAASDALWRPKLATAQTAVKTEKANQDVLQAALTRQNAAIREMGAQTYAKLVAAAKIQSKKDAQIRDLEEQIGAYLAAPPSGSTLCGQYETVDAWVLRGAKK